jgi:glycine/D-amino acid oxidase-like deaminating enzyme
LVAVVGAGLRGLAAALELVRRGDGPTPARESGALGLPRTLLNFN